MEESVVVIGAGGGLGSALVAHWLAAGAAPVIAVSRNRRGSTVPGCTGCAAITVMNSWQRWWPVSVSWRRGRAGW